MFQIQQKTAFQWEPIAEGDFDSEESAMSALSELETNLGWQDLRIVETKEDNAR